MKRIEIVTDTEKELKEVEAWLMATDNCPLDSLDAFVVETDMTYFYDIKDGKVVIGKEFDFDDKGWDEVRYVNLDEVKK